MGTGQVVGIEIRERGIGLARELVDVVVATSRCYLNTGKSQLRRRLYQCHPELLTPPTNWLAAGELVDGTVINCANLTLVNLNFVAD